MTSESNKKWWRESARLKRKNKRRSERRANDLEQAKKIYSDRSDAEKVKAYRNYLKQKQKREAEANQTTTTTEVAQ
ncbi:MAG: hypothetical protein EBU84_19830 [Actinobacteria bacterium]|nr:hypothetical protein [Actinomycetota bacterium]